MDAERSFQCEVEQSPNDEYGNRVTTVNCHGRLISETSSQIKEAVKPLITSGGRIVIDLGDVNYLDSSGLGALVGLKVLAIKQGYCMLEFVNMAPRIAELVRLTNLTQMLGKA